MRLKPIAVCMLTGALTMGGGVAAAAAAPSSTGSPWSSTGNSSTGSSSGTGSGSGTGSFNCANAPKALARIAKLESKAQAWLPKAQARETKAIQAGHTKLASRIAKRIQRVQKLEADGTKRATRIQSLCP